MFDKALITLKFAASCVLLLTTAQLAGAAGLPDGIDAQGKTPVLSLHAEGVQIYDCKADSAGKPAWQFREPLATLLQDNKTVGRHFAGPTWELADGTAIVGKVAAQAPGRTANDIAVLKLDVVNHRGDGTLSTVDTVQRLNTNGGVFKGTCAQPGAIHVEPYSADYIFLK
jgi:hypothetical protein